jgi:hypothetical protein
MTVRTNGTRQNTSTRLAARLGLAGAILGMLAGLTQMAIGTRIPDWAGAKDDNVALGALTIVLSAIAAVAATRLRAPRPLSVAARVAVVIAFAVPAVLCFTTVGRLWYLPGAMLLVACGLMPAAGDSRDLRAVVGANWARGLVSLLGAFVVLMAVSAMPFSTLGVGVGGGLVVMAAPWVSMQTKPVVVVAMLMAALPFAIVTWWSIASPLVALLALTIGITTIRRTPIRLDRHLHQG